MTRPSSDSAHADLAVIGGSGLYQLFQEADVVDISTDYGPPSAAITIAEVGGRRVAFLPRHGLHHEWPPHMVNYRANISALRQLGVRHVLAPCAVGSLRPDLGPGSLVIPDQLVDQTRGRKQTFHDVFTGEAVHASFADPYCARLRHAIVEGAKSIDWTPTDGGTMVVIEGPRFSTRAESRFFAAQGWDIVNMTGHPEAVLAREAGLCYAAVALVTDLDAGIAVGEGVTVAEVMSVFASHTDKLRELLLTVISTLPSSDQACCF
jgi:5'-methylthioadenosine phosphorylase